MEREHEQPGDDRWRPAIEDLLKFTGKPGHELTSGWALAPILTGAQAAAGDEALYALYRAFRAVLRREVEAALRSLPDAPYDLDDDRAVLRLVAAAERARAERLRGLALLWALYARQIASQRIMDAVPLARSTLYARRQQGIEDLKRVLLDHRAALLAGERRVDRHVERRVMTRRAADRRAWHAPVAELVRRLLGRARRADRPAPRSWLR